MTVYNITCRGCDIDPEALENVVRRHTDSIRRAMPKFRDQTRMPSAKIRAIELRRRRRLGKW